MGAKSVKEIYSVDPEADQDSWTKERSLMQPKFAFHITAVAALSISLSTLSLAQTAPTRSRVTITHVKPDMLNEWLDL